MSVLSVNFVERQQSYVNLKLEKCDTYSMLTGNIERGISLSINLTLEVVPLIRNSKKTKNFDSQQYFVITHSVGVKGVFSS